MEDEEKCPRCGTPRHEGMHPDNEDRFEVKRFVCHACRAVHEDRSRLENWESNQFMFFIPYLEGGD